MDASDKRRLQAWGQEVEPALTAGPTFWLEARQQRHAELSLLSSLGDFWPASRPWQEALELIRSRLGSDCSGGGDGPIA